MRCKGDACESVKVAWDEAKSAYVLENLSGRRIIVQFPAWPSERSVTLPAFAVEMVELVVFEDPFTAMFLD